MNVASVAGQLAAALGAHERHQKLDAKRAAQLVTEFLEVVASSALTGTPVVIPGFGTFYRSTSAPRPIRNPVTGEPMFLGPTWRLGFRPSKSKKGRGH